MARILFITQTLNKGGSEKQLALVAEKSIKLGHRSTVVTLSKGGWWETYLRSRDVPVFVLKFPGNGKYHFRTLWEFKKLVSLIKQQKPDIVVSFLYAPSIWASIAARMAKVSVFISSRRDCGFHRKMMLFPRLIEKYSYSVTTKFIANSQAVQKSLQENEGISPESVEIIYNGVDLGELKPQAGREFRKNLGIPENSVVVGMIANFWPHKNQLSLVEAAKIVIKQRPDDIYFILAGDYWEYQEKVEHEINKSGLNNKFRILGQVASSSNLIPAMDIAVLCSESEGFSNTILEYMAHNKPVIATRVGGNPEAVIEGETGYLIALNDYSALAKRIIELAENPAKCLHMGSRGRQHVEQEHIWDNVIGKWDGLFNKLVRNKQLF